MVACVLPPAFCVFLALVGSSTAPVPCSHAWAGVGMVWLNGERRWASTVWYQHWGSMGCSTKYAALALVFTCPDAPASTFSGCFVPWLGRCGWLACRRGSLQCNTRTQRHATQVHQPPLRVKRKPSQRHKLPGPLHDLQRCSACACLCQSQACVRVRMRHF